MALTWPSDLGIIGIRAYRPQHTSRSGGVSLAGKEQHVSTGFGRFRFGITVQVRETAHWKALNGLLWALDGSAGTVVVPLAKLQDRSGTATIEGATVGATEVDITVTGDPLIFGDYFSRSAKLYTITELVAAGPPQTVKIRPPIDPAITDGFGININAPECEMRLANDDSGTIDLDLLRMGDVTLDFVQA